MDWASCWQLWVCTCTTCFGAITNIQHGAALHRTPPPPGARLVCHWHINLIVMLVGQRDEIYPPHPDLIYKQ